MQGIARGVANRCTWGARCSAFWHIGIQAILRHRRSEAVHDFMVFPFCRGRLFLSTVTWRPLTAMTRSLENSQGFRRFRRPFYRPNNRRPSVAILCDCFGNNCSQILNVSLRVRVRDAGAVNLWSFWPEVKSTSRIHSACEMQEPTWCPWAPLFQRLTPRATSTAGT